MQMTAGQNLASDRDGGHGSLVVLAALALIRSLRLQLPKAESLESLRSKIASGKCPCRGSQISEVMIRFSGRFVHPTRPGLCPVTEKTIFKKSESDQPVTRFECENFSLDVQAARPARHSHLVL